MSRTPYQRMGNDGSSSSSPRGGPGGSGGARSPTSPRGDAAHAKHAVRHAGAADDPQAPWLTHLEYSVDPLEWDDDNKFPACPLCNSAFVVSMMGSGRHHCRICGVVCCGPCSRGSLDVPGYDSSERVCEPCRKKVLGLRAYLNKNHELLINNMHHNRDAVEFILYHSGAPWSTEIWLSASLLLLMYKDRSGAFEGVPIHHIQSVTQGFATKELQARKKKTVMCCMSVENEEFGAKEPCLLSLVLTDGRTLDFEAPTPSLRNEWAERLRGLVLHAGPFCKYHMDFAQYKVHELVQKEKQRLSIDNVRKVMSQSKQAERASKNAATNKIRDKYKR